MQKLLTSLANNDSFCDEISTDNSSTRSSFQYSESVEERLSISELENKFGTETQVFNASIFSSEEPKLSQSEPTEAEVLLRSKEKFFRADFIHRLTNLQAMQPKPKSKPHQTVVIFDWDDTLFPTSFLSSVGFDKVQTEAKIQLALNKIDKCVCKLLQKAVKAGQTYIVTNAMKNWVESSSESYLPLTYGLIKRNEITIISARSQYEKAYPSDPKRWKQEAFLDIKETLEKSTLTNIISVGDSTNELEAAQHLSKVLDQALLKTIKMKEGPSVEELSKQQETVLEKFDQIYLTLKNLAIKVERKN